MRKLIAIIRREYLARVRSKWFVLTTLLAPALLVAVMAFPVLLVTRTADETVAIGVLDESGRILPLLMQQDVGERYRFTPAPAGAADAVRERLRARVFDDELAGYLHIGPNVLETDRVEYWGRDVSTMRMEGLKSTITTALRRAQAEELGLEARALEKLTSDVDLEAYRLSPTGATLERGQTEIVAYFLGFAIYMVVLMYGAMMLRAAVSEKSNRMIEIILSSVRPWQLMLGKILGVGAVGLTQVGVWLAMVAAVVVYVGAATLLAGLDLPVQLPVGPDTLALFLGLFVTGYFLYAGLYAAVGAIATTEQEAAQLQLPVTLVAIVPIVILPALLNDPGGTVATVLSWVPFFAPVLFLPRHVFEATAVWEIPIVFGLLVLAIAFVGWLGGRIYRVGLLMTGKRPTLRELARWIRHG